jgi:hypothetical protein
MLGELLMAGCVCSNQRNWRHVADTQPVDVNVGYGASRFNNSMSAARSETDMRYAAFAGIRQEPLYGSPIPLAEIPASSCSPWA